MIFLFIVQMMRFWYEGILFSALKNPLIYMLLLLWALLFYSINFMILYSCERHRITYWRNNLLIAITKTVLISFFISTIFFGLWDYVVYVIGTSKFFTIHKQMILNFATHWYIIDEHHIFPVLMVSQTIINRIFSVLFLLNNIWFSSYFVKKCSYWYQDEHILKKYNLAIIFTTIVCFLICWMLSFI